MKITHGSRMQYESSTLQHRGDGLGLKILANGEEHTPENYTLMLAKQNEFQSPVHRHNFDQFRFALRGQVSLGPNTMLKEGHISYHPEGTYYGPQNDEPGSEKIILILQCGGASGQGYMSFPTLTQANQELGRFGSFKGGKYHSPEGKVSDGYQAIWEHVNGRDLVYPQARYGAPVVMNPDAFAWVWVGDNAWKRTLGVFTERELRVEQFKLCAGGSVVVGGGELKAIHLVYVRSGEGRVGMESLVEESCVQLDPGTVATVVGGDVEMVLLHYILPMLRQ